MKKISTKRRGPVRRRKAGYQARRRAPLRVPRRRLTNVTEMASLSCKRSLAPRQGQNFAGNVMYDVHNVTLDTFDRAIQVSKAYQFYRITNIALTINFPYDTFQAAAGNSSRPNLYFMLDKAQAIPANVTIEGLKQMGARPRACDNKPITIRWKPTVLTEAPTIAGPFPSEYKISPWLNTNMAGPQGLWLPSAVQHQGLFWIVEQLFAGGTQYECELEVQFQFRKPLFIASSSVAGTTQSIGVTPATQDSSPDGIVGGPDSNNLPSS